MSDNVIVIPYRNREKHLNYFIKNSSPLINELLPKTKIVIVEQDENNLFNRGATLNVGFTEYKNKTEYFITNDIDINPTRKCISELFSKEINDKSIISIFSHVNTLGGLIKIKNSTIHEINGFPNDIWGWGSEDDALKHRSEFFGYKKIPIMKQPGGFDPQYLLRFYDIYDRDPSNWKSNLDKYHFKYIRLNKEQKKELIFQSGLNNLKYEILERENLTNNTEKIKVKLL